MFGSKVLQTYYKKNWNRVIHLAAPPFHLLQAKWMKGGEREGKIVFFPFLLPFHLFCLTKTTWRPKYYNSLIRFRARSHTAWFEKCTSAKVQSTFAAQIKAFDTSTYLNTHKNDIKPLFFPSLLFLYNWMIDSAWFDPFRLKKYLSIADQSRMTSEITLK